MEKTAYILGVSAGLGAYAAWAIDGPVAQCVMAAIAVALLGVAEYLHGRKEAKDENTQT